MTAKDPKADLWEFARARWENEPACSFADLASLLNITKQGVGKRARKEGWQKKNNGPDLTSKAHAAADARMAGAQASRGEGARGASGEAAGVDAMPNPGPVDVSEPPPDRLPAATVSEIASVTARADVISRHRTEANAARAILYKSIKTNDEGLAKKVKANVEALAKLQEMERKAWGIESGDEKPTVVVERRG
ncbi:MAG TPA: hypothetical protein VF797_21635 [Noviherbaspirillum sp.]